MEERRDIVYIGIDHIHTHPENPRKDLGDLTELAESMKKQGCLQNLTVVPVEGQPGEYYALIGNRRHGASKLAGLEELPCRIAEGLSRKEQLSIMLEENMQKIIDFSELKDFMDVPIKNFSSGMFARLGFAVATIYTPDILIVDEILSVGDWQFQAKCHRRIQEMLEQGTTLLFVSHSMDQVKEVCNRAILLDHGHMIMDDKVEKVCDRFE